MSDNTRIEVIQSNYARSMYMARQWVAYIDGKTLVTSRGSVRRFKDRDTALKAATKALQSSTLPAPNQE
jgi:hypothetical protein